MSEATTGQVSRDAAEVYDDFFVPALFDQWPERVLDLAHVARGDRVLDVGCGTGVLARAAVGRVGPPGRVVGVDPNDGMRAVAQRRCPGVEIVAGFAEALPFPDASFDAVLSQFALMFFADREGALQEMRRVLRPGGRLVVLTWASIETSPGYAAMVGLLRELFGDAPAQALLAPFVLGTPELVMQNVGGVFPTAQVELLDGEARFPSVQAWVSTDIRGWTLREMIDDDEYALLREQAASRLAQFAGPSGQVRFPAPALAAHAVR